VEKDFISLPANYFGRAILINERLEILEPEVEQQ